MPYVKRERRKELDSGNYDLSELSAGELNYLVTKHVLDFLRVRPLSYERINTVLGVLEAIKQEVYRRIAAPYEDEKIRENGDLT